MSRDRSPFERGYEAGFKAGWDAREKKAVEAMAEMVLLVKPTDIESAQRRIEKRAQRTDGRPDYTGGPVAWDSDPIPGATMGEIWNLHVHAIDHRPHVVSFASCTATPCRSEPPAVRAVAERGECKDAAAKHRARHGGVDLDSFAMCTTPPCSLFWEDLRRDVYRRHIGPETTP